MGAGMAEELKKWTSLPGEKLRTNLTLKGPGESQLQVPVELGVNPGQLMYADGGQYFQAGTL